MEWWWHKGIELRLVKKTKRDDEDGEEVKKTVLMKTKETKKKSGKERDSVQLPQYTYTISPIVSTCRHTLFFSHI